MSELKWKPVSDLGIAFEDGSWSLHSGYEKHRIYAVELSNGEYDVFYGYIDEDANLCYANGDDTGWVWDQAAYYMDLQLPEFPKTEGGAA
jgi:hypothetical protein